ncbi:MAG: carbamoyl phosphate synthase small subunit [Acutalibacteraceae bacterium]|nr:carbamoyl phosphate synthase small subunit [Clostridiales bacterium]
MKTAYLLMADGTVYKGYAMGSEGEALGEVVFNTDMTASQELLQDPTYSGQIVVQTYPLIGNRGVDPVSESKLVASGYIVREWCVEPTDAHEFVTLDEYLRQQGIVGLCGIDTRALTRHIRDFGVMNGLITDSLDQKEEKMERIKAYRVPPAVGKITISAPRCYEAPDAQYKLAIPDYGFRRGILEHFLHRGCSCTLYPAHTPAAEILKDNPDGIVLSDGPGDPWDNPEIVEIIRELTASGKPLFGWGLGHQLMAVSAGFSIEKLPVGHRGSNQPVRNLENGRVMTTEQNHGYAVSLDSVDSAKAFAFLRNVNDGTVEGLDYKEYPAFTVQFEPADGKGYQDTAWVFDRFLEMLKASR